MDGTAHLPPPPARERATLAATAALDMLRHVQRVVEDADARIDAVDPVFGEYDELFSDASRHVGFAAVSLQLACNELEAALAELKS
jgi:hypothetical protein